MSAKFILIAGPCVIENEHTTLAIAEHLQKIVAHRPIEFYFKASYDKANRTSLSSFRGPGIEKGLKILSQVKKELGVKVVSDVHSCAQIEKAAKVLDVLQIPAFLARQTDLIVEAARTGKTINVKKAQFMSPYDMRYVVEKILSTSNKNIFLTERGTCFGYNNLVVDFRSFEIMKSLGFPVVFDVTHSLQAPSASKGQSGGNSEYVDLFSLAGSAAGVDGFFIEVHPDPARALSDKATSYPLEKMNSLLGKIEQIRKVIYEKE